MKEFALRHPWMTFFLVDALIVNVCKVALILTGHGDALKGTDAEDALHVTKVTPETEGDDEQ